MFTYKANYAVKNYYHFYYSGANKTVKYKDDFYVWNFYIVQLNTFIGQCIFHTKNVFQAYGKTI